MGVVCINFRRDTEHGCHGLANLLECKQGLAKGSPFSLTASLYLTCNTEPGDLHMHDCVVRLLVQAGVKLWSKPKVKRFG